MKCRNSRAFTLVEMLVAIVIIGILMSLLTLAVGTSRESSRRIQCNSNLRNWGVALAEYETSFRLFPCGIRMQTQGETGGFNGPWKTGPGAALVGFFGENALANAMNWANGNEYERWHIAKSKSSPSVFRCPSESANVRSHALSYVVNAGLNGSWANAENAPFPKWLGAFDTRLQLSASYFRDGMSSTAFMSEKLTGSKPYMYYTTDKSGDANRDMVIDPPFNYVPQDPDGWISHCSNQVLQGRDWLGFQGWDWTSGLTIHYNHIASPNTDFVDCGSMSILPVAGLRSANSFHKDGVNVLFGDGRVAYVADGIEQSTWRSVGTRSADDTIPE
jgi:prepilin-type N-terminal cleavage/methylation domain-containing protein/prepilin-type processing-associated H-X9-DG protein